MKRLVLALVRRWARRQRDQAFFGKLRDLALRGMNIGGGGDLASSGEIQVLELVARLGRAAPVVFDVGANEGRYALAARRALGRQARIFAFEPSTSARARLARAVEGADVLVVPLALGAEAQTRTLHADVEGSGLASLHARRIEHLDLTLQPVEDVRVEPLDRFCADQGIGRVDLLKLDVEGHEASVLESAGSLLAQGALPLIQFEFGGCNLDSRTYLRDFHRLLGPRYRLLRILRRGFHGMGPYRETDEVFTTTNYLACLRGSEADDALRALPGSGGDPR